jgi:hypothetical protein
MGKGTSVIKRSATYLIEHVGQNRGWSERINMLN